MDSNNLYYVVPLMDLELFKSSREEPCLSYGEDVPNDCKDVILVITEESDSFAYLALGKLLEYNITVFIYELKGREPNYDTGNIPSVADTQVSEAYDWLALWLARTATNHTPQSAEILQGLLCKLQGIAFDYAIEQLPKPLKYLKKQIKEAKKAYDEAAMRKKAQSRVELKEKPDGLSEKEFKCIQLGIPTEVEYPEDVEEYGFYEHRNCYFIKRVDKDGFVWFSDISNFTMKVKFLIESDDNPRRIVEFTNVKNRKKTIVLSADKIAAVQPFRVSAIGLGNFQFAQNQADFMKITNKLLENEISASDIKRMGWQKDNFWTWNNGAAFAKDGKVEIVEPDTFGIITTGENNYFLESASEMFSGDYTFVKEKKMIRVVKEGFTLKDWVTLIVKAYGKNGYALAFYGVASFFSDIIYEKCGFFPMLFLFGPPQEGKSTAAKSLMYLYTTDPIWVNLEGSTTEKGLLRDINYSKNTCVLLDEYSNHLPDRLRGMIKGFYNRISNVKAKFSNDNQTTVSTSQGGIMIAGQHSPTQDIALFTRCIYMVFEQRNLTEENRKNFQILQDYQKQGFTAIIEELLLYREVVEKTFKEEYTKLYSFFKTPQMQEIRLAENYAALFCLYKVLPQIFGDIAGEANEGEFLGVIMSKLLNQHDSMKRSDDTQTYWDIISYLANRGDIKQGVHYQFKLREAKRVLEMFPQDMHPLYVKEMYLQRRNPIGTTNDLKTYLEIAKHIIDVNRTMRIGRNRSSGWIIDIDKIGVELPEDIGMTTTFTDSELKPDF